MGLLDLNNNSTNEAVELIVINCNQRTRDLFM